MIFFLSEWIGVTPGKHLRGTSTVPLSFPSCSNHIDDLTRAEVPILVPERHTNSDGTQRGTHITKCCWSCNFRSNHQYHLCQNIACEHACVNVCVFMHVHECVCLCGCLGACMRMCACACMYGTCVRSKNNAPFWLSDYYSEVVLQLAAKHKSLCVISLRRFSF